MTSWILLPQMRDLTVIHSLIDEESVPYFFLDTLFAVRKQILQLLHLGVKKKKETLESSRKNLPKIYQK